MLIVTSKSFFQRIIGGFLMFRIKRFRKVIMKYYEICLEKPEMIKQNPDLYIEDLQNLICSVNYYLFDNFL